MDTFTLVLVLRTSSGFDDAAVPAPTPGGDLRLWRDDGDPTVVRGTVESTADDLDAALAQGRRLADAIAAGSPFEVEEVAAMDDVRQLVWRAKP